MRGKNRKRPTARTLLGRALVLVLIIVFLFFVPAIIRALQARFARPEPVVVTGDEEEPQEKPGLHVITAVDLQDAIITACRETSSFVVSEQDVKTTVELKRSFANWDIFTKTKTYRCCGTGYFAVDLSRISASDVEANIAGAVVKISIPRAALLSLEPDYTKTEFEDTEHGWLAFGSIRLTPEQQNEINEDVYQSLVEKLQSDVCLNRANTAALDACKELFTSVLQSVAPNTVVVVKFADEI